MSLRFGLAFGGGDLGAVEIEFGIVLQDIRDHRIQSHLIRWNGRFGGAGGSLLGCVRIEDAKSRVEHHSGD